MKTRTKALLGTAGGLLAAWVGWGLYVDRTTQRVPYETVAEFDGVQLRRYPRTVLVETTAEDEGEAFARLFRYISGENDAGETVSMTAPVGRARGRPGFRRQFPAGSPARLDPPVVNDPTANKSR